MNRDEFLRRLTAEARRDGFNAPFEEVEMETKLNDDETLPPRDFGWAIRALKAGHRVRRSGWNGKGMWLALTPGSCVKAFETTEVGAQVASSKLRGAAKVLATVEDRDVIDIGAHIDMRAADGSLVIGWLASQTDMLSEDWELVS